MRRVLVGEEKISCRGERRRVADFEVQSFRNLGGYRLQSLRVHELNRGAPIGVQRLRETAAAGSKAPRRRLPLRIGDPRLLARADVEQRDVINIRPFRLSRSGASCHREICGCAETALCPGAESARATRRSQRSPLDAGVFVQIAAVGIQSTLVRAPRNHSPAQLRVLLMCQLTHLVRGPVHDCEID